MPSTSPSHRSESDVLQAFFAMEERVANRQASAFSDDDIDVEDDLPTVVDTQYSRRPSPAQPSHQASSVPAVQLAPAPQAAPRPAPQQQAPIPVPPRASAKPVAPVNRSAPPLRERGTRNRIAPMGSSGPQSLWDRFTAWCWSLLGR